MFAPEPLSFTDPKVERDTFVAAMAATLIDKRTDRLTADDAAVILLQAGFRPKRIAEYLDDALDSVRTAA